MRLHRLFAAVVALGLAAGCASEIAGTPTPGAEGDTPATTDPAGYGGPVDQPMPLPPLLADDACDWMDDALHDLAPLDLKDTHAAASGCMLGADGDRRELIQARLSGPYDRFTEPTDMLEPVEVAGLTGRLFRLADDDDPTGCSIQLDIRSYSAFTVDAFNDEASASGETDDSANCELATSAAEILVRKYVPLAGGKPFRGTKQRADDETVGTLGPCEFVQTAVYSPASDKDQTAGTADFGTTCTYTSQYGTLRELMTDGTGGLDDLPTQIPDGETTELTFGDYPARQEKSDKACLIAFETDSGRVLGADYTNNEPATELCQVVRTVLASSIAHHLR